MRRFPNLITHATLRNTGFGNHTPLFNHNFLLTIIYIVGHVLFCADHGQPCFLILKSISLYCVIGFTYHFQIRGFRIEVSLSYDMSISVKLSKTWLWSTNMLERVIIIRIHIDKISIYPRCLLILRWIRLFLKFALFIAKGQLTLKLAILKLWRIFFAGRALFTLIHLKPYLAHIESTLLRMLLMADGLNILYFLQMIILLRFIHLIICFWRENLNLIIGRLCCGLFFFHS